MKYMYADILCMRVHVRADVTLYEVPSFSGPPNCVASDTISLMRVGESEPSILLSVKEKIKNMYI